MRSSLGHSLRIADFVDLNFSFVLCFLILFFFILALWIQRWGCRSASPRLWSRLKSLRANGWRGSILLMWWFPVFFLLCATSRLTRCWVFLERFTSRLRSGSDGWQHKSTIRSLDTGAQQTANHLCWWVKEMENYFCWCDNWVDNKWSLGNLSWCFS